MNAKVGFNEVQNYAKTHNIDFKTAAQKLGLSAKEAADLEKLGGNPGAPVDGFQAKIYNFQGKKCTKEKTVTLKSGRKVEVYKEVNTGKRLFQYKAADGTLLKEEYFLKQEGLEGRRFTLNGKGQLVTVKDNSKKAVKKQENESFWDKTVDFVKENARPILAVGAAATGIGLIATGVAAPLGVGLLAVAGAAALTSCSDDTEEILPDINNSNSAVINISISDQKALIEAFKEGIDALLAKMDELGLKVDKYGDQIIKLLTDNNTYLKNISNSLTDQGYKQDQIIEILTNINSTVSTIESLVKATNETLVVNGKNVNAQLTAILNAIKNGQATSMDQLDHYMEELRNLLYQVITNQKDDIKINEENGMTLDKILEALQNMDGMTSDKLEKMLEILQSIESIGQDISGKLDEIIGKFDKQFEDNAAIKNALDKIEEYLKNHNDKTDVTNNLLTQLLDKFNNGSMTEEMLQKILDAISKNGDKIDATNQLLAKIQDQDEKFQKNILNAINELGANIVTQLNNVIAVIKASGDTGKNIEALLNKVLEKLDTMDKNQKENAEKIIETINNFKVTGGDVDLSSIEKLLQDLINMTSGNNDILKDINAKMDVLTLTIERAKDEILEKMPDDPNTDAILKKLDEFMNLSNSNSSNILSKMDTIINLLNNIKDSTYDDSELMAKLDEILAAIKDHNVTVNVEGEVTCNCNCGQNHEGIIDNLEDVLG